MASSPNYVISEMSDALPTAHVIAGFAAPDLAALTAIDYLVDTYAATPLAAVRTRGLPDVAIVQDGEAHHPIRLYTLPSLDLTVLTAEVFVPVSLADRFANTFGTWLSGSDIASVTILRGGQFPHREEEHRPYLVASDRFIEAINGAQLEPLRAGMLDGVAGEVLLRSNEHDYPPAGVVVTPAHVPGPDIDAALCLLDGIATMFDLSIDDTALRDRAERLRTYYEGVADRLESIRAGDGSLTQRDFPEDRMYM